MSVRQEHITSDEIYEITRMKKSLKNLLWLLLLIALTVGTFAVIISSTKNFSFSGFTKLLSEASKLWIVLAVLCAFGFVYFEGLGLRCTCSFFGHPFSRARATLFSASDIYFSAITPSAAGGQPAALLLMMDRGVPAAVSAIALLLNLVMYTVSILLIGGVCIVLDPEILFGLDVPAQVFVGIGTVVQVIFIALFLMCIFRESLIRSVCRWGIRVLYRLHVLKGCDLYMQKLEDMIVQYKQCGIMLRKETRLLIDVFLCNLAQRFSVIMVAVCVFMAVGGAPANVPQAFCAQAMTVLGSNAMPVPGAVGIADYIFLNGFEKLVPFPVSVELLSRGISFYLTFFCCGIAMLIKFIFGRKNNGAVAGEETE